MRQLSTSDWTMVAIDSPHAHNTIGMVGIYDTSTCTDGPPDYDDVLAYIEDRLHVAESFRERILNVPFGLDRPYWVRDADGMPWEMYTVLADAEVETAADQTLRHFLTQERPTAGTCC